MHLCNSKPLKTVAGVLSSAWESQARPPDRHMHARQIIKREKYHRKRTSQTNEKFQEISYGVQWPVMGLGTPGSDGPAGASPGRTDGLTTRIIIKGEIKKRNIFHIRNPRTLVRVQRGEKLWSFRLDVLITNWKRKKKMKTEGARPSQLTEVHKIQLKSFNQCRKSSGYFQTEGTDML